MHPYLIEAIGRDAQARALATAERHRLVKLARQRHPSPLASTADASATADGVHEEQRRRASPRSPSPAVPV